MCVYMIVTLASVCYEEGGDEHGRVFIVPEGPKGEDIIYIVFRSEDELSCGNKITNYL